jgi:PKHD-type hydroxylase
MLVHVERLLSAEQVRRCRAVLARAQWADGHAGAGSKPAQPKRNLQLADGSATALELGDLVLGALEKNPVFLTAALPQRVHPPVFERCDAGVGSANRLNPAVRTIPGTRARLRSDLSATLFLSDRAEYDGGELLIEHGGGVQSIKLPAGDLVLYPAANLHRVQAVTRGSRLAAVCWIQSLIKNDAQRTVLFDLDASIGRFTRERGPIPEVVSLTNVYHNLLRMWAEP